MKGITRTVWILSLVSFFTDVASEMLYPVMPLYLKSIGFSILFIGILEGFAEATAGLSKGYFGKLSDAKAKRVPFVQLGYVLSGISKPLMVFFTYPIWIFFVRTIDRLGKGVRTGARDALLSDEATPATKGKVFGFHRALDTFGAAIGPSIALIFLYFYPSQYAILFVVAFVPGLLAIGASFLLKEKQREVQPSQKKYPSFFSFLNYWKTSVPEYRKLVAGLLLFTLFNSSDVFLLLKMKQAGVDDLNLIVMYILYNLVYALFALPLGILADKIGLKSVFIMGLLVFSFVYFAMGLSSDPVMFYALFLLYGVYAAATEGISKAWISNISKKEDTATAIGTFTAFQSISLMLASSIAGLIWYRFGSAATFILSGSVALLVAIYMSRIKFQKVKAGLNES
jgi:MFS family permease